MSSTFKNRIPKRKYRERAQPAGREHLGLLQKKQDYQARAKNYHKKEDMVNSLRQKATLKNQDEFYFKMNKGKRNQEGKFVEDEDSDSDFDEKEYRTSLKTQNYSIVKHQRSIVLKKIEKMQAELHMLNPALKTNQHKIFVESQDQLQNFKPEVKFKTTKQLADKNLLDVMPEIVAQPINFQSDMEGLKYKYNRLAEYIEKDRKLTKLLLKLAYQKAVLGKQRSKIKKSSGKKIHKFFIQRKK